MGTTSRRRLSRHPERHRSDRAGWLRAGVLGANDGLLSTAGLLVGVAAADSSQSVLAATGVASIIAGAASMGVGEFSSVSSQRDAEEADLAVERVELAAATPTRSPAVDRSPSLAPRTPARNQPARPLR